MKINILCIGDVVGRPGRRIIADHLSAIVKEHDIGCVIVNAENAAGGSGLTPQIYDKMLKYGVHLITLGDHAYRKRGIIEVLEQQQNIAAPANFSEHSAGRGYALYETQKGLTIGVISLVGRLFMKPSDCPYAAADKLVSKLQHQVDLLVVDFHAEASSEKIAMGYHLDGRVCCCFGTHTHVATADERILPNGTAYISDLGMTGAHDSVLGRKKEAVLKSFRTQMPVPFEIATDDVQINGIIVTVDSHTKRAEQVKRFRFTGQTSTDVAQYDSDDGKPEYLNNHF